MTCHSSLSFCMESGLLHNLYIVNTTGHTFSFSRDVFDRTGLLASLVISSQLVTMTNTNHQLASCSMSGELKSSGEPCSTCHFPVTVYFCFMLQVTDGRLDVASNSLCISQTTNVCQQTLCALARPLGSQPQQQITVAMSWLPITQLASVTPWPRGAGTELNLVTYIGLHHPRFTQRAQGAVNNTRNIGYTGSLRFGLSGRTWKVRGRSQFSLF